MGIIGPLDPVLTQALAAPSGPEDSGWHTGIVRSWDELSGVNVVEVNGIALTNLKSAQTGIGVQYGAGDNVLVLRKQTQYVVMGIMNLPGSQAANQIRYAETTALETTTNTSYGQLATVGPVLSNVLIGSGRRFLLMVNCQVQCLCGNTVTPTHDIGGWMSVDITGASTIPTVGTTGVFWRTATNQFGGGMSYVTRTFVMTQGNGVNQGLHTFSAKYRANDATFACGFGDRNITVIPF